MLTRAERAASIGRLSRSHNIEPSPSGRGQGEGFPRRQLHDADLARCPHPGPLPEGEGEARALASLWVQHLPRILDLRDRLEFDIGKVVALTLDPADIDVLDDVARLGVDLDRAARAVGVLPAGENLHRLVGVDLAALRLDRGK